MKNRRMKWEWNQTQQRVYREYSILAPFRLSSLDSLEKWNRINSVHLTLLEHLTRVVDFNDQSSNFKCFCLNELCMNVHMKAC